MASQQSINNICGVPQKPSVKLHHAPGGKSNWSIGWEEPAAKPLSRPEATIVEPAAKEQFEEAKVVTAKDRKAAEQTSLIFGSDPVDYTRKTLAPSATNVPKTSVRVANPPGGKSSINFC